MAPSAGILHAHACSALVGFARPDAPGCILTIREKNASVCNGRTPSGGREAGERSDQRVTLVVTGDIIRELRRRAAAVEAERVVETAPCTGPPPAAGGGCSGRGRATK